MPLDRDMRLLYVDPHGSALDITVGTLIDGIRQQILEDLKTDPTVVAALASAVATHLTATVRPT
jgi:hypothetical protein